MLFRSVPPRRDSPHRDRDYNARNDITQRAVDRRREECEDRGDLEYDDRNEPIGAPCFSRAIRRTAVPVGFKPPSDIAKYTGAEDPKQWLEDFDTRIRVIAGGTRTTAIQCMSLYLADSARAWLRGLLAESIRTWSELRTKFTKTFAATYKIGRASCRERVSSPV